MIQRIHILGASGSGTTTLGRSLARHLRYAHFDTDDYFWLPSDPPYTHQRERTIREQLLMDDLLTHGSWVLSGSLCDWGEVAIPLLQLAVFLWIPHDLRMERLYHREDQRFGERIMPGGDMYEQSQAFLQWADLYDTGDETMRSRRMHDQWLGTLPCPTICIEGDYAIEAQIEALMAVIEP